MVSGGNTGPDTDEFNVIVRVSSDGAFDVNPTLNRLEGNVVRIVLWLSIEANNVTVLGCAFDMQMGFR